MGMTCCSLPKLLGLSYAVVPDAVIITLFQIPGIICGSCQQTHDYSYYCCITVAGIVPALDFHHKVKTHAGQTKKDHRLSDGLSHLLSLQLPIALCF